MTAKPTRVVRIVSWGALGACAAVLGCRVEREAVPRPPMLSAAQLDAEQAGAQAALAEQARVQKLRFRVRQHPALRTVAFLSVEAAGGTASALPPSSSLGSAAQKFVVRYGALFGLDAEDADDEADVVRTDTDGLGMRHVRMVQRKDGVAIWGGVLVAHVDGRGALRSIHARTVPLPTLAAAPSRPTLQPEAARQQALAVLRRDLPAATLSAATPGLYYLADGATLALVYRVELTGQAAEVPLRLALFVDAHSGEPRWREDLVARLDVTVPATGTGTGALGELRTLSISQRGETYSLEDPTRGGQRTTALRLGEKLPGRTVTSKDPALWDRSEAGAGLAVDVHAHLSTLWDYFAVAHGRFGWDGKGHGLLAVTHVGDRAPLALFDGERLLFGDGDGQTVLPAGAALDVVAHEYAHALSRSTAGLAQTGESGALDEGLADVWACLVEQATQPARADWTIGEQIYRPQRGVAALRDLADPARTGQARTRADYLADAPAAPAVGLAGLPLHVRFVQQHNAGIAGHAGYELARRIGTQRTAAILLRALTTYLHGYAEFADAADAFAAAAADLYDGDTAPVAAVRASWAEVGVTGLAD